MNTARYRLRGKRHSGLTDQFTLQEEVAPVDPEDDPTWEAIDLTGYTARLQVRTLPHEEGELLATLTEGDGLTVTPLEGRIAIDIDETASVDIPAGAWWYDLRLVPPTGHPQYLVAGPFLWESVVTVP
jgi:hypothetical protein